MTKTLSSSLLKFILAVTGLLVAASPSHGAELCSDVFSINMFNPSDFIAYRLVKSLKNERPRTDQELFETLVAYYFFRKGDIVKLKDFKQDKSTREFLVFSRLLERQILMNGVGALYQGHWSAVKPSVYQKLLIKWGQFKISFVGQSIIKLPWMLPALKETQISEAMLRDLVIHGERSQFYKEGQAVYSRALRKDFYRKFSRVYTVVAYAFAFYLIQDKISHWIEEADEAK